MAACDQCGKPTSFFGRTRIAGDEFCSRSCADLWEKSKIAEFAKREREWSRAKAMQKAAAAEAKGKQEAAEATQLQRDADFGERLGKAGVDVHDILSIASQAAREGSAGVAAEAFMRAFALGISSYNESAQAKWEYARVLWRRYARARNESNTEFLKTMEAILGKRGLELPLTRTALEGELEDANPENLPEDVNHYLSEAQVELKRHIRSRSDDLKALRLLLIVTRLLGRPATSVEEQIKRIEIRQSLIGDGQSEHREADRSGLSFENRCLEVIRSMGFHAELTKASGDGGIDIIAIQSKPLVQGKYVIQCKDWANPVGEPVLRDLLGVVSAEDAVKGVLITSGTFTEAAKRFAEGKRLELIDGRDLATITAQLEAIHEEPT